AEQREDSQVNHHLDEQFYQHSFVNVKAGFIVAKALKMALHKEFFYGSTQKEKQKALKTNINIKKQLATTLQNLAQQLFPDDQDLAAGLSFSQEDVGSLFHDLKDKNSGDYTAQQQKMLSVLQYYAVGGHVGELRVAKENGHLVNKQKPHEILE